MKRCLAAVATIALFLLLSPPLALAQTDAGKAAQDQRDIAGRWLGATDAAVQEFGRAGGTLTNASLSQFEGVSGAIGKADWASSYGALSAGDVRGAVGGAVAIKVGAAATSGGAALFGEVGAVTGGVVGSFFPVVGNVAGTMVGGAIGTAAGGFITAYGYDKYVKDYVSEGVVAGIASVFDTAPLDQAMQTRRAFLLQTMAPEQQAQLQVFKPEEVSLLDFGALPYVPVPKEPALTTPAATPSPQAQQQAALPPAVVGDLLVGVKKIVLDGPTVCTIDNGQVNCTQPPANIGSAVRQISRSLSGVVTGNTLELALRDVFEARDAKCTVTTVYQGHYQVALEAGGRALGKQTVTMSVTGCSKPMTTTNNYSGVGTWRVLE